MLEIALVVAFGILFVIGMISILRTYRRKKREIDYWQRRTDDLSSYTGYRSGRGVTSSRVPEARSRNRDDDDDVLIHQPVSGYGRYDSPPVHSGRTDDTRTSDDFGGYGSGSSGGGGRSGSWGDDTGGSSGGDSGGGGD